jgi:hypothetical protein
MRIKAYKYLQKVWEKITQSQFNQRFYLLTNVASMKTLFTKSTNKVRKNIINKFRNYYSLSNVTWKLKAHFQILTTSKVTPQFKLEIIVIHKWFITEQKKYQQTLKWFQNRFICSGLRNHWRYFYWKCSFCFDFCNLFENTLKILVARLKRWFTDRIYIKISDTYKVSVIAN